MKKKTLRLTVLLALMASSIPFTSCEQNEEELFAEQENTAPVGPDGADTAPRTLKGPGGDDGGEPK